MIEPGFRKGGVHMGRARIPPRAAPVGSRAPCPLRRQSALHQMACTRRRSFPLSPQDAAELMPYPSIPLLQRPLRLGQLEVRRPAAQEWVEGLNRGAKAATSRTAQQYSHFRRQSLETRRSNAQLRFLVCREAITQKSPLPRPRNRTLGVIHLELELLVQKPSQTVQQPHARPVAS